MKKLQQPKPKNWLKIGGYFGLGILTGLLLVLGVARLSWHTKFYPGLKIAGVDVSGMTREEARAKLTQVSEEYQAIFSFNGSEWIAPPIVVEYELESSLNEVYSYGRRLRLDDYLLLLFQQQTDFPLQLAEGKTEKMEVFLNEIAGSVEIPPIEPTILVEGKAVKVVEGTDGVVLDTERLGEEIAGAYARLAKAEIEVPVMVAKRQLGSAGIELLSERGTKLVNSTLVLSVDDKKIALGGEGLVALLATDGEHALSQASLNEYVVGLSESVNSLPQDAKFEFVDGEVVEFAPGKDGIEVSVQLTANGIQQGILELLESDVKTKTVEIVVTRTPPSVTTEKVNELGIRERIGRGESYYAHSIANRIYNVGLSAERTNSALIPPGEEYSFNQEVGEISGATGYRTAYVISGGRTVLGDGGGVCQVSTTVFRAALAAGLPITERWAHAYRVGYYEQNSKAGVDATIYAPSKDLKFLNDTPGHILVQTINDPKNLYLVVEIYGTNDGRVASISEPKVWGVTPPPPDIFQDDPTLPSGSVKQVDWSAWGAKASFDYKVVRGDEVLQEKTFSSTYRPWANVYLRGTGE